MAARYRAAFPFQAGVVNPPRQADFPNVPADILAASASAARGDPLPFDAKPDPSLVADLPSAVPPEPEARLAMARAIVKDVLSSAVHIAVPTHPAPPAAASVFALPGHDHADSMPLFMVQSRSSGKWRMCHDARFANAFLPSSSAIYESIADVADLGKKAKVMTTVDAFSAYRQCPLSRTDSERLGFRIGPYRGVYRSLPFGLSWAPARFIDVLRPVLVEARARGVAAIWYMDDIAVFGEDAADLARSMRIITDLFASMNLLIAPDKFPPYIHRVCPFLGCLLDLNAGVVAPTPSRLDALNETIDQVMAAPHGLAPLNTLRSLLGVVSFISGAGRLPVIRRALDDAVAAATAANSSQVFISPMARDELRAIRDTSAAEWGFDYRADADRRARDAVIMTVDSGEHGWGAVYHGRSLSASGPWPDGDDVSSAAREIEGISRAIEAFDWNNVHLVVVCDATAAIHAITRGGRSFGTAAAARALASAVRSRRISLDVIWCSREMGMIPLADALGRRHAGATGDAGGDGRRRRTAEWSLDAQVFRDVCGALQASPTVDLFASAGNARLPRWCTRVPAMGTEGCVGEGHTLALDAEVPYVFAPWSQARKAVLRWVRSASAEAVFVIRRRADDRAYASLVALEALGRLHVRAAVAVHHSALVAASGARAREELAPTLALRVCRGGYPRGGGRPLWWTRERLVCVEPNPGPDDDPWEEAKALRVLPPVTTLPSVAAAVDAIRNRRILEEAAVVTADTIAWAELWTAIAALHAQFTPASTAEGQARAAKRFADFVQGHPGVNPAGAWTDDVAAALLARWAIHRAEVDRVCAKTIRNDVFAVRAVLRLWGQPLRDERRILYSTMFRIGCFVRARASRKTPFTVEKLDAIYEYLRSTSLIHDMAVLRIICAMYLAFALAQRGQTIRALRPHHIVVDGDAIALRFDGPSKTDQRYKAAPPRGHATSRTFARAAELLRAWLRCLPPGWSGRLFPVLVQSGAAAARRPVLHAGWQWIDEELRRDVFNNYIKVWASCAGIRDHLTFHCLRVAGAQSIYRDSGGSLRLTSAVGDWASDAVLIYLAVSGEEARAIPDPGRTVPGQMTEGGLSKAPAAGAAEAVEPAAAPADTAGAGPLSGICTGCGGQIGEADRAALCVVTTCTAMCCKARCWRDLRRNWWCPEHSPK